MTRNQIGAWGSLAYLFVLLALTEDRWGQLLTKDLNEVGDFLAGAFSPLAFLWLVLGFLQQGEELQESRKALHLQAEELRHSVEQQRQMVEVARQEHAANLRALDIQQAAIAGERAAEAARTRPRIYWSAGTGTASSGKVQWRQFLRNTGGICTQVRAQLSGDARLKLIGQVEFHLLSLDSAIELGFLMFPMGVADATLNLLYTDASGVRGQTNFVVHVNGETMDLVPTEG